MLQIQKRNQDWLPDFLNEFFYDGNFMGQRRPLMNVIENEKDFQLQITAPGFTKENASISVNGDELQISFINKEENEKKDKYIRHEFVSSSYKQSFVIPDNIDKEKISASMENGILNVVLPKYEPTHENKEVRQIAIC